jgi:protein-tyrosine phosphatase
MIDLHCHLLPGVDDGPRDMREAVAMCARAVDEGITHAVTTPHIHLGRWDNSAGSIAGAVAQLREMLLAEGVMLHIGFAGEVRVSDQLPGLVEREEIPFYGEVEGYRVMLLEFPHGHIPPGGDKLAAWLLSRRIRPMIAHPERNKQVMRCVDSIYPFVEAGCWLQVTGGAVCGSFGEAAEATAHHLLREDLVTVIASDAHNLGARPPGLRAARDLVAQSYGEDRAARLLFDTPAMLVEQQFPNDRKFSSIAGL